MDKPAPQALGSAVGSSGPRVRATDIAVLLLAVTVTVSCTMMLRTAQQLAEITEANARQSQVMMMLAGKIAAKATTPKTSEKVSEPADAMQDDSTPRD